MKIITKYTEMDPTTTFRLINSSSTKYAFKDYVDKVINVKHAIKYTKDNGEEILAMEVNDGDVVQGNSAYIRESFDEIFESFGAETFEMPLVIISQTSKSGRLFLHVELA